MENIFANLRTLFRNSSLLQLTAWAARVTACRLLTFRTAGRWIIGRPAYGTGQKWRGDELFDLDASTFGTFHFLFQTG
jgi:hypothetical protein